MVSLTGIIETALYVDDLQRSARFFQSLFHLEILFADDRLCALSVADRHVLLLFRKGGSLTSIAVPGGSLPPHDGDGPVHMAFSVNEVDFPEWERWLNENNIAIERTITWSRGGKSLYFRDPDNHSLELVTPGTWAIY